MVYVGSQDCDLQLFYDRAETGRTEDTYSRKNLFSPEWGLGAVM